MNHAESYRPVRPASPVLFVRTLGTEVCGLDGGGSQPEQQGGGMMGKVKDKLG